MVVHIVVGYRIVFEDWVLRKTFRPMWDEGTGERRRIYNEELCDIHFVIYTL